MSLRSKSVNFELMFGKLKANRRQLGAQLLNRFYEESFLRLRFFFGPCPTLVHDDEITSVISHSVCLAQVIPTKGVQNLASFDDVMFTFRSR